MNLDRKFFCTLTLVILTLITIAAAIWGLFLVKINGIPLAIWIDGAVGSIGLLTLVGWCFWGPCARLCDRLRRGEIAR